MARAGRPPKITPAVATKIQAMAARGMAHGAIAKALARQGGPALNRSTVQRYLARRDDPQPDAPAPGADLEGRAAAALDADEDLAALQRILGEVARGMREWGGWIGSDPRATRAYAQLARLAGELHSRAQLMRPKPEVERERMSELGASARAELIQRARARAETDWRARAERAMRLAGVNPT